MYETGQNKKRINLGLLNYSKQEKKKPVKIKIKINTERKC